MQRSVRLTVWLGMALGVGAVAYFLRGADWPGIGQALARTHLGWLALAFVLNFSMYLHRTCRWRIMLAEVAPVRLGRLLTFTFLGFGANVLLPARAGELIKALLVTRETGARVSSVLATIVLERLADLAVLLVLLAVVLAGLPALAGADAEDLVRLRMTGLAFFAVTALTLVFLLCLSRWPAAIRAAVARVVSPFPTALGGRVLGLLDTFILGLGALRSLGALAGIAFWSVALWGSCALSFWATAKALDLDIGLVGGVRVLVVSAFAVALPQAPGFIGVYQVACEWALRLSAVAVTPAKSYALLSWMLSAVPVALLTLYLLSREGLSLRGLEAESEGLRESGPEVAP